MQLLVNTWVAVMYIALLTLTTCSTAVSAARAPVFVTKKPAMTREYMLLSTYVNPVSEAFKGPEVIESQDGMLDITLTVEETRVRVAGLFDYNARSFCYQNVCHNPAPSLHVKQGDQCTIKLVNKLPSGPANTVNLYVRGLRLERDTVIRSAQLSGTGTEFVDSSSGSSTSKRFNANPRPPNVLSGVPGTDAADILLRGNGADDPGDIAAYESITYRFTVPLDHAPGMHYYHSNTFNSNYSHSRRTDNGQFLRAYHKNAALHMMEGLVGALHVHPRDVTDLPQYLRGQLPTHEVVLSHVMLGQNSKDTSEMALSIGVTPEASDAFSSSWSLQRLHEAAGSSLDLGPVYYPMSSAASRQYAGNAVSSVIKDVWLTSGKYQPTLSLFPSGWTIFDILCASGDRHVELELRDAVGYNAGLRARKQSNNTDAYVTNQAGILHNSCEVVLLALDGVYLEQPRFGDNVDHLVLLPGTRAKIAVMCVNDGVYYLQSASTSDSVNSRYSSIGGRDSKSAQLLAKLVVSGPPRPSTLSGAIARPKYLTSQVPLPYYASTNAARKWSVGLEQRGADAVSTAGTGGAVGAATDPQQQISFVKYDATKQSRFWLGQGVDCSLPCYQEVDCEAYYGADYSVFSLHNVKNGECVYNSASTNHIDEVGSVSFSGAGTGISVYLNETADINLYGRHPRALLPFSLSDGTHFQVVDYVPATAGPATVRSPSAHEQMTQNSSHAMRSILQFYGEVGDWRDTWPVLPGRTTVRTRFTEIPPRRAVDTNSRDTDGDGKSDSVTSWIHCNALKYEDGGLLGSYDVVDHNGSADSTATAVNSINGSDPAVKAAEDVINLVPADSENAKWVDKDINTYSIRVSNAPLAHSSSADGPNADNSTQSSAAEVEAAIGYPFPPDGAGVKEAFKCEVDGSGWFYREIIDAAAQTRTLTTNGCPNHYSACQNKECGGKGDYTTLALQHPETLVMPLYPQFATVKRDTTCSREKVGVALNGVGIFSRADSIDTNVCYSKHAASDLSLSGYLFGTGTATLVPGEQHTACAIQGQDDGVLFCGDEIPVAAARMDRCGGVSDKQGVYKYHLAPVCLMDQLSRHAAATVSALWRFDQMNANETVSVGVTSDGNTSNTSITLKKKLMALAQGATAVQPSPQVGWALDGFPIYGPVGTHGILMLRCGTPGAHASVCLDSCNGYKGSIDGDHFIYRYHMAGDVSLDAAKCSTTTKNAHIDSTTLTSVPIGTKTYIANGNSAGTNSYTGCGRLSEPCCIEAVPPSTRSPYTIGCFAGCKYGESGCVHTGEKGTTSAYEPRADMPLIPTTVHVPAAAAAAEPSVQSAPIVGEVSEVQAKQAMRSIMYQKQLQRQQAHLVTKYGDNVPRTSSYLALQQISQFSRPVSLIQVPFGNPALALVDTPDNKVANVTSVFLAATATQGTTTHTSGGNAAAKKNAETLVSMEVLPAGFGDAVISGLTADAYAESQMLYYSTRGGVYALHEQTKVKTLLLAGYTRVVVTGFNFGASLVGVRSVSVNGKLCDTPVWESSTRITCVLTALGAVNKDTDFNGQTNTLNGDGTDASKWFTAADVTIVLETGATRGVHPEPELIRRSGSGRPAISSVEFEYRPFQPRAISSLTRQLPASDAVSSTTDFSTEEKTVTSTTFSCDAFSVTNTNDAKQNYKICEIEACDGDVISASTCAVAAACVGDTYFTLHADHVQIPFTDEHGGAFMCDDVHDCPTNTYADTELANNNDLCGKCSGLEYQVPPNASSRGYVTLYDGTTRDVPTTNSIYSQRCRTYYLRQGCTRGLACSGNTQVTVSHTTWATPIPLSLQEQERLQKNVKAPDGKALDVVRRTLYYSDISEGGSGLLRCWLHADVDDYTAKQARTPSVKLLEAPACTQVEVVTSALFERVQSIVAVPAKCLADASTSAVQVDSDPLLNLCDLVLFVDARTSALWRVLLPGLVPSNVYDYRTARRSAYIPPYDISSSGAVNIGTPVRLLNGLVSPSGLALDLNNLVTASAGAVDIATAADAGSYSAANTEKGTVGRAFLSFVEGQVLRVDSTLLLSPATTLPYDLSTQSQILVRVFGLTTVLDASSKARLGGVASLPMVPSPTNWTQHRCFVVDANQQAIYASTEWVGGAPSVHNTINLGVFAHSKSVLFPVQVAVRPTNVTSAQIDMYVAEYLGKIWKVRVPLDPANDTPSSGSGTVLPLRVEQGSGTGGPELLFDESDFPASIQVRKIASDATRQGIPVNQKVFFEGLQ